MPLKAIEQGVCSTRSTTSFEPDMSLLPSLKSPLGPTTQSRKYWYVPELFCRLTRTMIWSAQPGTSMPRSVQCPQVPVSP
jgi:hypothetical protein